MKKYAGIGSRETPEDILKMMREIARAFETIGYTLRSGGAKGADQAFEGRPGQLQLKEIFYANDATEASLELASQTHPGWHNCSDFAKKLHARNGLIMFGYDLDDPVDFVICWTKNGEEKGGTAQAIRLAKKNNIKVYNLFFEDHVNEVRALYQAEKKKLAQTNV